MEINDLSNRWLKIIAIKMFAEVRRVIKEQRKNFGEEIENIQKLQREITELKIQ